MSEHPVTIAIDFDGVLATYDKWISAEHYGAPHPDAMITLRRYLESGIDVVIHTTRASTREGRNGVKSWLRQHGLQDTYVERIRVTNEKVPCMIYLDDRAVNFRGRFPEPKEIKEFKPYYKGGDCEDQTSIGLWTFATFPDLGGQMERKHRVIRILEECIEFAHAEGLRLDEIADYVGAAMNHVEKQQTQGDSAEESGDLMIALLAWGFKAGIDVNGSKEAKMRKNRARPQSYYDMKTAAKRENGLFPKEMQ